MGSIAPRYSVVRLFTASMLVGAGSLAGYASAQAQATLAEFSEQRLDRVDVVSLQRAFNLAVDTDQATRPWVSEEYAAVAGTSVAGTNFTACQNTATRGLYCLDGNKIRRWPNPEKTTTLDPAVDGVELFNCGNAAFALDSGATCTALAVDLGGNVWLAGKKKSKFSLFKVVPGACPTDPPTKLSKWTAVNSRYCAREFASGRPLLIDLSVIDGDVAAAFPYSEGGVLGVEERKEVTFFRDAPQAPPVVVGSGRVWGLAGGEQLQSATLLQKPLDVNSRNWVLVTTSLGKLLSREIPWDPLVVTPVTNHANQGSPAVNLVAPASALCGPTALYATRSSVKTRAVYVSDRRGCRLLSLKSNIDAITNSTTPLSFLSQETIASTTPTSSTIATLSAPPEAVSIAPGIEVDLREECGFNTDGSAKTCTLVGDGADGGTFPGASLTGVRIDDATPSGLTVFQIQNIPDCRYLEYNLEQPAECKNGAIRKADGTALVYPADYDVAGGSAWPKTPEFLFLNITPLLPPEVTKVYTAENPLPSMLMSPKYKALASRKVFDALFGVTDSGVRFRNTFKAEFDLGDLLEPGFKLGCGGTFVDTTTGPLWDVLLTISEAFTTVGGFTSGGAQHTDMLVNKDFCSPADPPAAGARWSLYPYGLQMSKEQVPSRTNPAILETRYPDSIFAKLVLSLFADLGATIDTYLCVNADPGGSGAPVAASACGALRSAWVNTTDKLIKCVESSTEPKTPSGIQTCQAFEIQYASFSSNVDALVRSGSDPGNRVGEVKARKEVFRYVYERQYLPSIPPLGFEDGLSQ